MSGFFLCFFFCVFFFVCLLSLKARSSTSVVLIFYIIIYYILACLNKVQEKLLHYLGMGVGFGISKTFKFYVKDFKIL